MSQEGLLLKYVNDVETKRIMHEVHEGICGAHKSSPKIRWLIHSYRYCLPTIVADCATYTKGYKVCQMHGPLQKGAS